MINDLTVENKKMEIGFEKTCNCSPTHINCLSAKEWLKNQIGVWQFNYETRDIRDKSIHPATFPISLAKRVIELFSLDFAAFIPYKRWRIKYKISCFWL